MSVNTLTLTAGGTASVCNGYAIADASPFVFGTTAPMGSLSPASVDGNTIGTLLWQFASAGNAHVNLTIQYSGSVPPDSYITSVTFTGDTGTYTLDHSGGLTTSLVSGTVGTYKQWQWNRLSTSFPSQADPFTNGNNYTITVTTSASSAPTPPVPSVLGLTVAAADAAIVAAGFTVGTLSFTSTPAYQPGQIAAQSPAPATPAALGTAVNLTENLGPVNLTVVFVDAPAPSKSIMLANPGNINPRIYPPMEDTTVRVPVRTIV